MIHNTFNLYKKHKINGYNKKSYNVEHFSSTISSTTNINPFYPVVVTDLKCNTNIQSIKNTIKKTNISFGNKGYFKNKKQNEFKKYLNNCKTEDDSTWTNTQWEKCLTNDSSCSSASPSGCMLDTKILFK